MTHYFSVFGAKWRNLKKVLMMNPAGLSYEDYCITMHFQNLKVVVFLIQNEAMYRFVKLEDQKRTLVSQLLQYTLVHEVLQIPFGEIVIKRTLEGKPFLVPTSL